MMKHETSRTLSEWDYIVVGSGTAGAILAARLSEDPDTKVLLLEAGPRAGFLPFAVPGLGFAASFRKDVNWRFQTEPIAELGGRSQTWLQGKLTGGSGSINGMIYTRGHALEYDSWRQMGCTGWGFEDVLPYFRKAEAHASRDDAFHASDGAVPIRTSAPLLPVYSQFLDACARNGMPVLDDLNRNTVDGFGYYDVNIGRGLRTSTERVYLKPAERRPNLTVWTGAEAQRLVFEGRKAVGVVILRNGREVTERVAGEVVICGGAIKSPQLLMLSGIGPAEVLKQHGIEVLKDAPELGENLQNHPSYRMQYACKGNTTGYNYLRPLGAVKAGLSYLVARRGGLAESIFGLGGFFRTEPHLEVPDIQVVMCGALMANPATDNPQLWQLLPRQQGFSLIVYQGSPFSRGRVGLRSADGREPPVIETGYFRDERDMRVLVKGIQRMRQICNGPDGVSSVDAELAPGPDVVTDADLEQNIRDTILTSFHQCGTCAMGGRSSSVVDPQLRVRGVEGVRVADASIIPVMPNAALQGPIMMIAEKAAAMIRAGK